MMTQTTPRAAYMTASLLLLPFWLFVSTAWAQDATTPAAAAPTSDALGIIGRILADIVFPLAGTALVTLITFLVHKLIAKFHVDEIAGMQDIVDDAIKKGIHYAEAWAEAQKAKSLGKPLGSAKAQQAFSFIEGLLGTPMIKQYGEQKIQQLIESLLHSDPPVPAAPTTPLSTTTVTGA